MAEGLGDDRAVLLGHPVLVEHLVGVLGRLPGPGALGEDLHHLGPDLRPPLEGGDELPPGAYMGPDAHVSKVVGSRYGRDRIRAGPGPDSPPPLTPPRHHP